MKVKLACLTVSLLVFGCSKTESIPSQITFDLSSERFRKAPAYITLQSLGNFANVPPSPVSATFVMDQGTHRFIFRSDQDTGPLSFISIDLPKIYLISHRISYNGEEISIEAMKKRISQYEAAANRTDSAVFIRLTAAPAATNETLAEVLTALKESTITNLVTSPAN